MVYCIVEIAFPSEPAKYSCHSFQLHFGQFSFAHLTDWQAVFLYEADETPPITLSHCWLISWLLPKLIDNTWSDWISSWNNYFLPFYSIPNLTTNWLLFNWLVGPVQIAYLPETRNSFLHLLVPGWLVDCSSNWLIGIVQIAFPSEGWKLLPSFAAAWLISWLHI
jgi:hypothetical protein